MTDGDDAVASLLRLAGARPPVPAERAARVKTAVGEVWRDHVRARRRRRVAALALGGLAAAAAVVVVARAPEPLRVAPAPPPAVAVVEAVSGPAALRVGDSLPAGSAIDTGGSRATLRLSTGSAVRLDVGTRVRLRGPAALVLAAGAVYVDSGDTPGAVVAVYTPLGIARDVGTRFEVRLGRGELRVRVRDGLVRLERAAQTDEARPGDELTADSGGAVARSRVLLHDPEWDWILKARPPFRLEGRTLADVLAWASREGGWTVRFTDAATALAAPRTVLHGSIDGLTPRDALTAILPTCGQQASFRGGTVVVQPLARPGAPSAP